MKKRVKDNQEKLKQRTGLDELIDILEQEEEKKADSRMNVIGQNGNDGLHYEKEAPKDLYAQTESFPQAKTDEEEKKDIYQEKPIVQKANRNPQNYG